MNRREKAKLGIGSIAGGLPPCLNCETEPVNSDDPVNPDDVYCSPECRKEDEGE